jgi:hypothetical protein
VQYLRQPDKDSQEGASHHEKPDLH